MEGKFIVQATGRRKVH